MCAGYAATHPCERADQSCLPIPPPRLPGPPNNPGAPPSEPSDGNDTLTPGEMSCKQLDQQIKDQQQIIILLDSDISRANNELAVAERNLNDVLSENAVNVSQATADTACSAWSNLLMQDPDMYVCTEPRAGKPPICKLRKLKPSEQAVKNNCDTKKKSASDLAKQRSQWLDAAKVNRAIVDSAQRKKAKAQNNLKALRDAKNAKAECL